MEGADVGKVVTMMIRHDLAEARIGDLDKVAVRYIRNKHEAEEEAMKAQLE